MCGLHHNYHDQSQTSLVLSSSSSSHAKPRLKWTRDLHGRFVEAANQLGGAEATPKALVRVMGIHGLSLYHLKSHLQKHRLGRIQLKQEVFDSDYGDVGRTKHALPSKTCADGASLQINENSLQTGEALHMQMEVQRKLYEQIQVQRHLQLRIEAQGKYLQSVLKKAHAKLFGYNSCSIEVKQARAELSELVSMVDPGCPASSDISFSTQSEGSGPRNSNDNPSRICSLCSLHSSSTTSCESSERLGGTSQELNRRGRKRISSTVLELMEKHPGREKGGGSASESSNKKKIKSSKNDHLFLDLNRECRNDLDSGPKVVNLNCNGL